MNQTSSRSIGGGCGLRIYPPLLAAGLLIATLILHLLGGPHHYPHRVQVHEFIGLLTAVVGAWFSAFAAGVFTGRNTTLNPYGEPAQLVDAAPFTFTRNPMYAGVATLLLGFALFFWSPVMLLAPIIFFLVIDRAVIPREEQNLERIFGAAYQDYQRRVRRWL